MNSRNDWVSLNADDPETGRIVDLIRRAMASERNKFQTAIVLEWKFDIDDYDEFLQSEEKQLLDKFEDVLEQIDPEEEISALVLTIVNNRSREWVFYTSAYQDWLARLNATLANVPQIPITIQFSSDPEWNYWSHFAQHIPE